MLFENGALPNLKQAPNDELAFLAELPPLGYASYIVSHKVKSAGEGAVGAAVSIVKDWTQDAAWNGTSDQTIVLGNGALTLTLSASTGSIVSLRDRWVAACASEVAAGAPESPTGAMHDACMPLQQTDLYWAGMIQCGGIECRDGKAVEMNLVGGWYNSSDANGPGTQGPPSGPYIFRPNGLFTASGPFPVTTVEGPVLTEIRQVGTPMPSGDCRAASL